MPTAQICRPLAVAAALLAGTAASAAEETRLSPGPGDDVVVYTHHFTPEAFEEGLALVKEGFTAAQAALGKSRLNYFLVDRDRHDVVVVSFFGDDADVDEWHDFAGRMEVLGKLEAMRRSPLELQPMTLDAVTTAP